MRVVYDGWPLVFLPNTPAALHTLTLLAYLPRQVEPIVAFPAKPPSWFHGKVETCMPESQKPVSSRLAWEQRHLPKLAKHFGAQLIHLTSSSAPLLSSVPWVVSPAEEDKYPGGQAGLKERLRESLGQGGLSRTRGLIWPADLPHPVTGLPLFLLPPVVHPDFRTAPDVEPESYSTLDLPETFVLYHGPQGAQDLKRLLSAWTWASPSIGEYHPLLILGLGKEGRSQAASLAEEYEVSQSIHLLPEIAPQVLASIYRHCSVLFHPTNISPWENSLRAAMACARPIAAAETPQASAIVGPAAFLAPPADARALGAALITLIVETELADGLSQQAKELSEGWDPSLFQQALLEAYTQSLD